MKLQQSAIATLFLVLGLAAASNVHAAQPQALESVSGATAEAIEPMPVTAVPALEAVDDATVAEGMATAQEQADQPVVAAGAAVDATAFDGMQADAAVDAMEQEAVAAEDADSVEAQVETACAQFAEEDQIDEANKQTFIDNCVADNMAAAQDEDAAETVVDDLALAQ